MDAYNLGVYLGQAIFLLAFIIPAICFFITQQNTLKSIQPQNRMMTPGQVWLQMIPLFNLVWQFIVVARISQSIAKELSGEGLFSFEAAETRTVVDTKPTYGIGISYCILYCFMIIPFIKALAVIPLIICWIIYWVKLAGYKRQIQQRLSLVPPVQPNAL
jgi:hypothetical protein